MAIEHSEVDKDQAERAMECFKELWTTWKTLAGKRSGIRWDEEGAGKWVQDAAKPADFWLVNDKAVKGHNPLGTEPKPF